MTNDEAYGGVPYEDRARRVYKIGDRVLVGPAYYMGGSYEPDGDEGVYYVLGRNGRDYKLASHPEDHWEIFVHASRLTPYSNNRYKS